MTDNEIIKALECCFVKINCTNCPCNAGKPYSEDCLTVAAKNVIDLVNRQKADIDRLTEEKENLIKTYIECMTDCIKSFADKFKENLDISVCGYSTEEVKGYIFDIVDDLVKEMTEGKIE